DRQNACLQAELVAEKLLFIPHLPKFERVGIVNEVHLVQIADEGVGKRFLAVQPEGTNMKVAAFVTRQFLGVEVQRHGEQALVNRLYLPTAGNDGWQAADVKKLEVHSPLRQPGAPAAPGTEQVILLEEAHELRVRRR